MNQSFGYLPQNERKKILLICDDIRVHSGVATVARELVLNTAQHFNWVNVGGAINHPEAGKRMDLSADTNNNTGLTDSSIFLYPTNGYGDARLIRQLIQTEKPDSSEKYGRILGWLFIGTDAKSLNEQMIAEGYAWKYDGGTKVKDLAALLKLRK